MEEGVDHARQLGLLHGPRVRRRDHVDPGQVWPRQVHDVQNLRGVSLPQLGLNPGRKISKLEKYYWECILWLDMISIMCTKYQ